MADEAETRADARHQLYLYLYDAHIYAHFGLPLQPGWQERLAVRGNAAEYHRLRH